MTFRIAHEYDGSHRYTMATGKLLGRSTAGEGAVEELDTAALLAPYLPLAGGTMTGAVIFADGMGVRFKQEDGTTVRFSLGLHGSAGTDSLLLYDLQRSAIVLEFSIAGNAQFSGNVGIGAATPAWDATYKTLSLGTTAAFNGNNAGLSFSNNAYYDGTNWKYVTTEAATTHYQYQSRHVWSSAASGTAGTTATLVTVLQVDKAKSLALEGASSESGTGITFPATQSSAANVNTLDDYEEGTWTPSLKFGGASVGMSYATQGGSYVKIGQLVYAQLIIDLATKGSSTGTASFTGLPFTVDSTFAGGGMATYYDGMAGVNGITLPLVINTTTGHFWIPGAAATVWATDANFTDSSTIVAVVVYQATA